MDQLSDVFRSMRIQGAAYKRLEATAPWGVRYSGDIGPRGRFGLVVRGCALLTFKNHCFSTRFGLTQVAARLGKRGGWLPCQTSISAKLYKRCVRGSRRTGVLSHWLAKPGCRGLPLP